MAGIFGNDAEPIRLMLHMATELGIQEDIDHWQGQLDELEETTGETPNE